MRSADESGATAVEYSLMLALIAAVVVLAVTALGQVIVGLFTLTWA
jgi:pilus assembly protein Flp/PilA